MRMILPPKRIELFAPITAGTYSELVIRKSDLSYERRNLLPLVLLSYGYHNTVVLSIRARNMVSRRFDHFDSRPCRVGFSHCPLH